ILGDLDERYQERQSRLWYWRHVLVSVIAGFSNEAKMHRLRTASGVAIGWLSLLLLMQVLAPVYLYLHKNDYLPMLHQSLPASWFDATAWWSYYGTVLQPFDWIFVSFGCLV